MLGIWRQGSQLWANLERRRPLCIKTDMAIPYSVFEEGTLMWEVGAREKQHCWRGSSHLSDTKGTKGKKAALSS